MDLRNFHRLENKYFDEIMEALQLLSESFNPETMDSAVVKDTYSIIFWARALTSRDAMLKSGSSFTKEKNELLIWWIELMENAFYYLLNGNIEDSFFSYEEYLDGRYH